MGKVFSRARHIHLTPRFKRDFRYAELCCITSEAGWLVVAREGWVSVRGAVATAADAMVAAVPAEIDGVAEGTDAAGVAVATVAALAVVVLVSTTVAAGLVGCGPWLCWIKASESGVSFLSAGRLLCRNTEEHAHKHTQLMRINN